MVVERSTMVVLFVCVYVKTCGIYCCVSRATAAAATALLSVIGFLTQSSSSSSLSMQCVRFGSMHQLNCVGIAVWC